MMRFLLLSPEALLYVFLCTFILLNKSKKLINLFLIVATCKGMEKKNEMSEGIN
jgi:hypothetical protein